MSVHLDAGPELAALRTAVRDLAVAAGGPTAGRHSVASGDRFDFLTWRRIGTEMGLAGLGMPETAGGVGGGLPELAVVAEEIGHALLAVPFLTSTVLAGQVLAHCPSAAAQALVGGISGGDRLAAFIGLDSGGAWKGTGLAVSAQRSGDGWRLTGACGPVFDGLDAADLVVAASGPDGCDLFAVDAAGEGITRHEVNTLDQTRAQATVEFTGASAEPLTAGGRGAATVTEAIDVVLVAVAAEQVGGAQACLDQAVDYAKIRRQFGRSIGSFQAIKHDLSDLLLLVELGRSALDRAVRAEGTPGFAEAASIAKAWCSDTFVKASSVNIQVHGGIGFTWEHDAHLYFRRARADAAMLGDADWHRERIASLLGW